MTLGWLFGMAPETGPLQWHFGPVTRLLSSHRYRHFLLHSCQALWGRLRAGVGGGRGVSPRGGQVQLPLHHLQEPALHLPLSAQVRQPEDLHQGVWSQARWWWEWILKISVLWLSWSLIYYLLCCVHWLSDIMFSPHQARNIAVCIQFRDSDEEGGAPLKVSCMNCKYIWGKKQMMGEIKVNNDRRITLFSTH